MNVYGYLRVSTARQAQDGLSIEVQEEQIGGYAQSKGLAVHRWFRDRGVSGSVPFSKRDKAASLLESVEDGDTIICAKLDRMFRNAKDALDVLDSFKKRNISLHFIDLGGDVTNGIGQLVFTILSAVAEQERHRIRERISDAKEQMRKDGRYQGGKVPFGYRVDSDQNLVEDEIQQKCIAIMKKKRKEGMTYRAISQHLMDELGVRISYSGVRKILLGDRKTGN